MAEPYKILYKFPSRERPNKFFSALGNIISKSNSSRYMIECTLDLDDPSMNNDYVCEILDEYQRVADVRYTFGHSEGKVHAINRDMDKIDYDWDIVVVMSDDMKFVVEGFDEYIRAAFNQWGLDSVVHFNDGNSYGKNLMTLNV